MEYKSSLFHRGSIFISEIQNLPWYSICLTKSRVQPLGLPTSLDAVQCFSCQILLSLNSKMSCILWSENRYIQIMQALPFVHIPPNSYWGDNKTNVKHSANTRSYQSCYWGEKRIVPYRVCFFPDFEVWNVLRYLKTISLTHKGKYEHMHIKLQVSRFWC